MIRGSPARRSWFPRTRLTCRCGCRGQSDRAPSVAGVAGPGVEQIAEDEEIPASSVRRRHAQAGEVGVGRAVGHGHAPARNASPLPRCRSATTTAQRLPTRSSAVQQQELLVGVGHAEHQGTGYPPPASRPAHRHLLHKVTQSSLVTCVARRVSAQMGNASGERRRSSTAQGGAAEPFERGPDPRDSSASSTWLGVPDRAAGCRRRTARRRRKTSRSRPEVGVGFCASPVPGHHQTGDARCRGTGAGRARCCSRRRAGLRADGRA